ncbi:MAG: proton-conducting transporter membrane subunit [Ignavibacteriaceae bacterium]|nr:proton-conducting transporter membrane subunit [Ignavibacteriaceae bacterium]
MIALYIAISLLITLSVFLIRNRKLIISLVVIFVLLQWILTCYEYLTLNSVQLYYFTPDAIGIILLAVLSVIASMSFLYSFIYLDSRNDSPRIISIYLSALILLIMAISCAYLANHVAIAWIFVEITTLSSSVLIYHRRTERSLEGSWKYIFICSVSVALIFMGILFLGMASQQAKAGDLFYSNLVLHAKSLDELWLKAAFLFIFTGYTAKLGLFPMYTAGIDAKDKAPSPASAVFSSALMNVGFIGVFRMYGIISKTNIHPWVNLVLIISALISLIIAAAYMLRVKSFKRMFAYSSVEHMGIAVVGLTMGSMGIFGSVLHVIFHSFTKAGLFYQYGSVNRVIKSKFINDAGEYFEKNTSGALVLLLGFFMVTAIPPSGMFISEYYIFRSLFEKGYLWLLIVFAVLITVIIWALGENIFRLLFYKPPFVRDNGEITKKVSVWESVPQFALMAGVMYLGVNPPGFLIELINQAVKGFS